MLTLLLILLIIGVVVALVPMDSRIRTAIIVIALIWVVFSLLGYAPIPNLQR